MDTNMEPIVISVSIIMRWFRIKWATVLFSSPCLGDTADDCIVYVKDNNRKGFGNGHKYL